MVTQIFRLRGNQRLSEAVMNSLGDLEQRSLKEVWRRGELSVNELCLAFDETYAYTTVMTTLDRLYKKGLLTRRKLGRAFVYKSLYSIEEIERNVASDVISKLLDATLGKSEPLLACIVDSVSDRDRDLLNELERLVTEKQRQRTAEDES